MTPNVLNKAEVGNKALKTPLAQLMLLKGIVADQLHGMEERLESGKPISGAEMEARGQGFDDAWSKFTVQHDKLRKISGRGHLFGLESCYSDLSRWWLGHSSFWHRVLKVLEDKEAAVMKAQEVKKEKPQKKNLLREAIKSAAKSSADEEWNKRRLDDASNDYDDCNEEECYGNGYCVCSCRDSDDDDDDDTDDDECSDTDETEDLDDDSNNDDDKNCSLEEEEKDREVKKEKPPKKNLLREAIKAAAKPSAAEAGESPPVDPP